MQRLTILLSVVVLWSASAIAQDRSGWRTARDIGEGARGSISGTVIDVDAGRNRLQIETDEGSTRVQVETDSVATEYHGFGSVIADRPEIFTGNTGFANIRLGDRVEVRGTGRGSGAVMATYVTLLGRPVTAGSVGVGSTRSPSNPTNPRLPDTAATTTRGASLEGTVRQINTDEGRLVVQTRDRRLLTVRTSRNTPVMYRGEQFRIGNLEVGDTIRVIAETGATGTDDIGAARIEVIEGVQETASAPTTGGTFTIVSGSVDRVDVALNQAWINTGREQIRVDMSRAEDARGERIGARDLAVGGTAEISGSYNRVGDIFVATTVRTGTGASGGGRLTEEFIRYGVVTIDGTVVETLDDASTLGIRERATGRVVRVWATEDLVVRLRATSATAARLRVDDSVRIKAFRDPGDNLIAQTITVRNR